MARIYGNKYLKKTKDRGVMVIILLLYYWVITNLFNGDGATTNDLFIYVQLPVIIFVVLQFRFFEIEYRNDINIYFILFLVVVILINVIRGDFKLILSTAVDVLPVYLILTNRKNFISLKLINYVFAIQIVISVYSYYLGINPYGFISGQSTIAEYPWKISLFSHLTPPFTSIFAFLILLVNAENKPKINIANIVMMGLAAYFIAFSGSRTTYLILAFYLIYKIVNRFVALNKWPRFYLFFPFIFNGFALFIGSAITSLDSPLLNAMFIRNVDQTANYKATEDLDRYIMWKEYLTSFQQHWFIGAGYFDVVKFLPAQLGTTETLLPMMLAFHGIVYFIFLTAMIKIMRLAIKNNLHVTYILVVTFFVAISFYGSYMRGYNLIWIFLFLLIANDFNTKGVFNKRQLIHPRIQ